MAAPAPKPSPPPRLSDIARPALFLDFDGTLVELAASPDAICVPDYLCRALERRAAQAEGRLAIVSGRFVADIRRHMPQCGVTIVGSHGAEIVTAQGAPAVADPAPRVPEVALAKAQEVASSIDGLLVEEKAFGLGLHYRDCPSYADALRDFAQRLASEFDLHLREGKMVVELATSDASKGTGVRALMASAPFVGSTPVFVGDDVTDEDGFAAVNELGGLSVLVGEGRATQARYRLPDVAAVHHWLELE